MTYSYDVFGAIRSQTGFTANEFQFTDEQRDPQSGRNFYYLRARYYDPATGRFLGRDPLGEGNGYSYASNNPVNLTDPSGLTPSLWEALGIDPPSFSMTPPIGGSLEEVLAWFHQQIDWLYNVLLPAIHKALGDVASAVGDFASDAFSAAVDFVQGVIGQIDKLSDALEDLWDFVKQQGNDLVDWVVENQDCISFVISSVAFSVAAAAGFYFGIHAAFAVGVAAGAVNIGLNYAQGDKNGAARGEGFLYGQGALYAMNLMFPSSRVIPLARLALGVTGIGVAADGCGNS